MLSVALGIAFTAALDPVPDGSAPAIASCRPRCGYRTALAQRENGRGITYQERAGMTGIRRVWNRGALPALVGTSALTYTLREMEKRAPAFKLAPGASERSMIALQLILAGCQPYT